MTDTPTPRTDARESMFGSRGYDAASLAAFSLARILERELIDAMAEEARAKYAGRELEHDLTACRAALRELVACKDLKDTMPNAQWYPEAHLLQTNEYQRRKPLAWAAARALATKEPQP